MDVYANYDWYKNKYLGTKTAALDAAVFDYYARKATQEMKRYVGENINTDQTPETVKICCCELAEMLQIEDANSATKRGISSESIGDLSVSYTDASTAVQALNAQIKSVVYTWLTGTGFLYRGR